MNKKPHKKLLTKKEGLVERVTDGIMDNLYDYHDLVLDLVKFGVSKWTINELKDFIGDDDETK